MHGMQADAASVRKRCSRRHREFFYRQPLLPPRPAPEEDGLTTVEGLASGWLTWAFITQVVAGAGFEPATFGL